MFVKPPQQISSAPTSVSISEDDVFLRGRHYPDPPNAPRIVNPWNSGYTLMTFFALSACTRVLTCSIASSTSSWCSRHALTLAMRRLRCPGHLTRLESFQVSSSDFFVSSFR